MKTIEKIKLSDVFELISKPKYVLGTTYTLSLAFFESVVFPYIDRSNLRSCLILCDLLGYQRALTEGAALQGAAQDYMVIPSPLPNCFHPKTWLLIGDFEAILLCGSGNLTQAGFMTNAELFDALHFTEDTPATAELLQSMRTFIRGLAKMWPPADAQHLLPVEILSDIEGAVNNLPIAPETGSASPRFIHSFDGPLIEQMPKVTDAREIYAAAPFFGNSIKGIDLLAERYPGARLRIFPAVHGEKATDAPLANISKTYKDSTVSRLSEKKGKGAFAHLKLYGIASAKNNGWLYCTSANCTEAAWRGPNIEAGILRPILRQELSDYFEADNASLPENTIAYEQNNPRSNLLHFWASDVESHIEVFVAENCSAYLPLTNVRLTVRAGSNLADCQKAELFKQERFARIDWTHFRDWKRRRKMAVCLDIEAKSASGAEVRGSAFVENRLLLTADPIHRSAWRGALTLLSEEGAPELADIAAIFTLAHDLFDGTLIRKPKATVISSEAGRANGDHDEQIPAVVAVWPPQADIQELKKRIGTTGVGELQWFQRILQTFLQSEKNEEFTQSRLDGGTQSDEDDTSEAEKRREDEETRAYAVAERIWEKAQKDYNLLYERLFELLPTIENAPNIWPAAIFVFLSTMAMFRAVRRMAPGVDFGMDAGTLSDDFVRVMLGERQQDEDFCCPKGFRYKYEKFPSLADDLRQTFKVEIHIELVTVMLALIVDQKLRSPVGSSPLFGQRQINQICDCAFVADAETRDASQRIWMRYLRDDTRKEGEAEFTEAFKILCNTHRPRARS